MARTLRPYRMLFEPGTLSTQDGGLASKLGGEPDWIQSDEWPDCEVCDERMTFVGQIDSIEHDSPANPHQKDCMGADQDYMFGDVGKIYVFLCEDCLHAEAIVQC